MVVIMAMPAIGFCQFYFFGYRHQCLSRWVNNDIIFFSKHIFYRFSKLTVQIFFFIGIKISFFAPYHQKKPDTLYPVIQRAVIFGSIRDFIGMIAAGIYIKINRLSHCLLGNRWFLPVMTDFQYLSLFKF